MSSLMEYMTEGCTPRSKWYDGDCLLDRLKIYALRIAIIVSAYHLFSLPHEPHPYIDEDPPPEMNCSRSGWGGDC